MKRLLIGSLLLIIAITLVCEESELRPYKLINADQLIVEKINNEYITYLMGNVHFFYGETECFTDSAEVFEKQKITRMYGNVRVYDDTLSLVADNAEYFRLLEEFHLSGDVLFKETHADSSYRTFRGELIDYYRNTREVKAYRNVKAYDSKEALDGRCGRLEYNIDEGYGYLMEKPTIMTMKNDSLSLSAEKFEYYDDFKKIVANFNVKTTSKDFDIYSNFLIYFSEEQKATYLGDPRLVTPFAEASAREFRIFFTEENKLDKAVLEDSCKVYFTQIEGEEKFNWVESDLMNFYFADGKIDRCVAETNVTSYYQQEKTDKEDFYANRVTGNKMILTLDRNKINELSMDGDVSGVIRFESNQ